MENATKALLIAAGVIFAVIIFVLIFFMYNNLTGFYQSKESNLSAEQLAVFNNQYSVYNRELSGFELVSLINKAIDFNQTKVYGIWNKEDNGDENSIEGYAPITVKVKLKETMPPNGLLFSQGATLTYTGKNKGAREQLEQKISTIQQLETKYKAANLTKLASHTSDIMTNNLEEKKLEYTGKTLDGLTLDDIKKYEDYLSFKKGTYDCKSMLINSSGQINYFEYEQTN